MTPWRTRTIISPSKIPTLNTKPAHTVASNTAYGPNVATCNNPKNIFIPTNDIIIANAKYGKKCK